MTRRRRNQTLDALAHRIDRAADIVPDVLAGLDEQRTHINALRAAVGGTGSSDVSDPTLRTVIALDGIEYKRQAIKDAIATLGVCVDMLDNVCRDALGRSLPEELDAPRCSAEVLDPADAAWPLRHQCTRYVEHFTRADGTIGYRSEGLCAMHRRRADRAAKGLTEEDAA